LSAAKNTASPVAYVVPPLHVPWNVTGGPVGPLAPV